MIWRMESRPTLTLFGVASSGSGKCKQIHVVFPFFLYLSFKSLRPGRHKDVTMCWIVSINVVNGQCEAFQAIGQGPFWWRNDDDTAVIMIVIQHSSHLNLKGRTDCDSRETNKEGVAKEWVSLSLRWLRHQNLRNQTRISLLSLLTAFLRTSAHLPCPSNSILLFFYVRYYKKTNEMCMIFNRIDNWRCQRV